MKILIIDDQELVLLSLEKCLTDLGYEVQCANNVFDALAQYEAFGPNLVIADINLPMLSDENATDLHLHTIAGRLGQVIDSTNPQLRRRQGRRKFLFRNCADRPLDISSPGG